ncbi:hypothetical protein FSP39_002300 [Pinctada imbricata]|uniref:B box-type domain-containing protein n=1 Tax=Pinctada imbricata TaxID=66713 RepID=A0AA88XCF2_PINIB|nr:hypothetical protein FSP39_002300 [Pinctada imbricata]
MSDQGATAFPVQTMVECGICGGTFNVDWFCKTCGGSLCDTCYQAHQTASLFRNHIVVPRTVEVLRLHGPAKIAEICRIHPTKEISTYCNDCKIPCCVLCHHEKHNRHEFSPIEDKYLSAEKSLDQYTRELQTDVKPSLDALKDSLKHHLKKHDEQIEKEKDEINTLRYTLKQKVDESCDLLLKELDQAKQDFRNFEKEIDSSKQRLDQLIKDLEIMIGEGKLDIIEYSPPTRKSLIPASPLPVLKVPKFVPGRDLIGLIQNKIGRIEFHDQISDNEEANASSNTALDIDISEQKSLIQVKVFDKDDIEVTKVKSFKSKFGVSSLTSAGNNSAWVMCNNSNTMYLYDSNGDVVRSIKVKNSQGINDMVITRSGDMIVTCRDKTVRRVSVGGEVSTLINTGDYMPTGVCLTDKEEIVVCMCMMFGGHLAVFSPDGRSKVREIRGVDSQGNPQIIIPHRVVCNDEDLCVVCRSKVVCVDESDNVKWVYDGKQANLRGSFNPRGICVDKYHNLLVTDYINNCVHYVDREGGLIQVIMTQEQTGLWKPWGICVDDETGQVWVGNHDGDVSDVVIAKYLK